MRYTIGQELPFIAMDFDFPNGTRTTDGHLIFQPGYNTNLSLELKILECVEHYKVRGEFEEDSVTPKYDGFVFKDKEGNRYFNQYPTVYYGQTSDDVDRIVRHENKWRLYRHALYQINSLHSFIKNENLNESPWQDHLNELISLIETQTNKKITFRPIEWKFKDGTTKSYPDITKAVLE